MYKVIEMKLPKLNHMSILILFAIAFIVIYLYYTISDVKKIHLEVKKMSQDIDKLSLSIANITTSILPMLQVQPPSAAPVPTQQQPTPQEQDDESVASQELNQIMESIEDEDTLQETKYDISQEAPAPPSDNQEVKDELELTEENVEGIIVDAKDLSAMTVEELKKVSYNEIKRYCKQNNIDDKGTKDVLIQRIKNKM
jgi:hypothetical protein